MKTVETAKGPRCVTTIPARPSLWNVWNKREIRPEYLSCRKDKYTNEWSFSVWGANEDDVRNNVAHLAKLETEAPRPTASTPTDKLITPKQQAFLRRLLKRLEKIENFDSFGGSGKAVAEDFYAEIKTAGGIEKLTIHRASAMIDRITSIVDDEM